MLFSAPHCKALLCCLIVMLLSVANCKNLRERIEDATAQNQQLQQPQQQQQLQVPQSAKQDEELASPSTSASRQLFAQSKETSTPNFVRLVVMRLMYGLASSMGLEERLEGAFNGIFVPPNADSDDIFSGGGGDGDAINLFGGGGSDDDLLGGLFDADY